MTAEAPTAQTACCTRRVTPEFYDCLVTNPKCDYAVAFGDGLFCCHPNRHEFSDGNGPFDSAKAPSKKRLHLDLRSSARAR